MPKHSLSPLCFYFTCRDVFCRLNSLFSKPENMGGFACLLARLSCLQASVYTWTQGICTTAVLSKRTIIFFKINIESSAKENEAWMKGMYSSVFDLYTVPSLTRAEGESTFQN